MPPPKIPAAKTSAHPLMDPAQVIAQAAKNLKTTNPNANTKPKDIKPPTVRKAEKRPAGDSGVVQRYMKMSGSAMW